MAYKIGDLKPNALRYDDIDVGDEASLSHCITQKDVEAFAKLTGDFNPVHLDAGFAKLTTFGKPVVHGMLTSSFISTMIGMLLPGPGALWTSQTLEFLAPTYIGDEITVVARVKQKSPATQMIVLEIAITNQHGAQVVFGDSTVRLLDVKDGAESSSAIKGQDQIEPSLAPVEYPGSPVKKLVDRKAILVLGGSRGIGAATVKYLAAKGDPIVFNYLKSEGEAKYLVEQVQQQGGQAIAIRGDVASSKVVEHIFSTAETQVGPISSVVYCAAPNPIPKAFGELQWEDFQKHLDTQIKGAFNCVQRALPQMIEAKSGAFVFLGSIFADGTPPIQQSSYVVTKAALAALVRSLAVEYGPKGIRVNVVSPGMTRTEMIANIPEKVKMLTKMNTPMRQLAEPEDIASAIVFLLGSESGHITGETLRVCGGLVMR